MMGGYFCLMGARDHHARKDLGTRESPSTEGSWLCKKLYPVQEPTKLAHWNQIAKLSSHALQYPLLAKLLCHLAKEKIIKRFIFICTKQAKG